MKVALRLTRERSRAPPQIAIHGQPGMPFLMTEELILARMDPRYCGEDVPEGGPADHTEEVTTGRPGLTAPDRDGLPR